MPQKEYQNIYRVVILMHHPAVRGSLTLSRRIDYHDDPNAPKAGSRSRRRPSGRPGKRPESTARSPVPVFYRGAWCPYRNIALSAYQAQLLLQLTERGIRLIAVSPQKPDGSLTIQQKHSLA